MKNNKIEQVKRHGNGKTAAEEKVNSNDTAAICNIEHQIPVSRVGIPSEESVDDAKDWVDNGSRL